VNVAKKLAPSVDFAKMNFMTGTVATFAGIPNCRITRCGYTGEDGFEISVAYNRAMDLAK
jgi:aminomethyltransferase